MAPSTQTGTRTAVTPRIVSKIVLAGGLAAVGSVLVLIGVTDFIAYWDGYRPGASPFQLYTTAIIVLTTGWLVLIASVFVTGRTLLEST